MEESVLRLQGEQKKEESSSSRCSSEEKFTKMFRVTLMRQHKITGNLK